VKIRIYPFHSDTHVSLVTVFRIIVQFKGNLNDLFFQRFVAIHVR
jgi:hypothetical protein